MKFLIHNQESLQGVKDYISKLNLDKRYEINITLKKEKRTIPQNRLYWLYVTCIADETGNSKEDIHNHLKQTFLKVEDVIIGNASIAKTISTTKLNTSMMANYINQIVVWASSECGIILPDPADYVWEQFYEKYKDRL